MTECLKSRVSIHKTGESLVSSLLLTEKEEATKLTRWWMRNGILEQFRLAKELIGWQS